MRLIQKLKCFSSLHVVVFVQFMEARCSVDNEDVVGAAPTGDAPTISEWSIISLPTKVQLILEVWSTAISKPFPVLLLQIFGGFLVNLSTMSDWLVRIKYLSLFRYSLNVSLGSK